jgi:hypothetical protein
MNQQGREPQSTQSAQRNTEGDLEKSPDLQSLSQMLEERAKRGDRAKFRAAMAQIPDVEPEEYDRLP